MSLGFLNGNLRSHPHKKLVNHLKGVTVLSSQLGEIYKLPIDISLIKHIGITHDLGKAHPEFQRYLDKKGSGVNHAEPSAWFTYLLTHDLWAAEAVHRHHTYLRDIDDLEGEWIPDGVTADKINKKLYDFLPEWPLPLTSEEWDELDDLLFDGPDVTINEWLKTRLLYSVLISADRMDALGISEFSYSKIPAFLPLIFDDKNKLAQWREETRQICLKQADQVEEPGVYTLTLPTGAGKTLLGLEIARTWAERFNCRTIIYALPFISIVEQNAAEAKKVFGNVVQEDHSLAYAGAQGIEDNNFDEYLWHKMLSLFRYWREPIVVTTMVQLWEALFNTHANKTMNFHKLSRAVVILDEPQSISPYLWKGLSDILNHLSKKLGSFFLFMTATQPHINAEAELAPNNLSRPFERHRYLVKKRKYEFHELADLLRNNLPVDEGSGLVVLNTKLAALKANQVLKDIMPNAPVLFLSAWMTPWHRKKVLALLHELEEKSIRRYLVSTQVVEAGVNLDFEWVFRDMGPLDSIVQVAGRCNRHLKHQQPGKVLVAELVNNKQSFASAVYDDILLLAADKILPREIEFGENEVGSFIDAYYSKILDALRSLPIFDNLSSGKWNEVPSLIEKQSYREVDIFIEQSGEVREILGQLQSKKWSLEDRHKQKELFRELQQFMIRIPEKYVHICKSAMMEIVTDDNLEPFGEIFGGNAYLMTKDGINAGLYNKNLGFIPPDYKSTGVMISND